jgi:Protein of Unknown function (DUF2784)
VIFGLLADLVVLLHLAFIVFVVAGGLLWLRFERAPLLHVPAALWGAFVELDQRICPLTPLELLLRERAGQAGYPGGFVEHYVTPLVYPEALTRPVQIALGALVLVANVAVYGIVIMRRRRAARAG